jgi:hypothetical protein
MYEIKEAIVLGQESGARADGLLHAEFQRTDGQPGANMKD